MQLPNPLATFTLLDLADYALQNKKQAAFQQATEILERMKHTIASHTPNDPGYTMASASRNDIIFPENLAALKENGFRVWRVTNPMLQIDGKHYVSWTLESFDDVFQSITSSYAVNEGFSYTEL